MVFISFVLLFYLHAFIHFFYFLQNPQIWVTHKESQLCVSPSLSFILCSSCKRTDVPDYGAVTVWPKAYQHSSYQQSIISYQGVYTEFSSLTVILLYTKLSRAWGTSKECIWLHKETEQPYTCYGSSYLSLKNSPNHYWMKKKRII